MSDMRFRNSYMVILMAAALGLVGCGEKSDDPGIFLSGTYALGPAVLSEDAPVLVALVSSIDRDALENHPRDVVIEYMVADRTTKTFRMDLFDKKISPDQDYYLFAFVDNKG